MASTVEKPARRWTYEEYYKLDDDQRYEIIEGNLLMVPAPDTWHQDWVGELYLILRHHVTRQKAGKVFLSPVDVVLDPHNTVQPDLVFIAQANLRIIQHRAIFGIPDLLVELVSSSGARRDRQIKWDLYARFGVKEYWIGDPAEKTFEVLTLKASKYEPLCSAERQGRVTSLILPGLVFDVSDLG
jgi:Uma2 family endonuclease